MRKLQKLLGELVKRGWKPFNTDKDIWSIDIQNGINVMFIWLTNDELIPVRSFK